MSQNSEMPIRTLGRTGVQVSLIGLGGWHLGFKSIDEELGIRMIRTAIDNGINFMDNCWDYNEGASEIRMGRALRDGYRERAFVMTKIDGRTKQDAAKQLTNRCNDYNWTISIWSSITRSFAMKIPIESSTRKALTRR